MRLALAASLLPFALVACGAPETSSSVPDTTAVTSTVTRIIPTTSDLDTPISATCIVTGVGGERIMTELSLWSKSRAEIVGIAGSASIVVHSVNGDKGGTLVVDNTTAVLSGPEVYGDGHKTVTCQIGEPIKFG